MKPTKGSPSLRRIRVLLAALVILLALAAFIDFREAVPLRLKHIIASVQFVPSAFTLFTAFHATSLACLLILALTFAFGRVYCSVLCPLGILQDSISRISAKIRRAPPYKLPYKKPHNILRHAILAVAIASLLIGWGGFVIAWLDPYSHFGRVASALFQPLAAFANNIAATIANALGHPDAVPKVNVTFAPFAVLLSPLLILTALVIMAAFRGRLWCNTICPVGTLLGAVSRRALWRVSIDKTACRKCGDCLRVCKSQCINLRTGEVDFSRCVACYNCVSVCDEQGIHYRWHGLRANPPARETTKPKFNIPSSIARPPAAVAQTAKSAGSSGTGDSPVGLGGMADSAMLSEHGRDARATQPAPIQNSPSRRAFITTATAGAFAVAGVTTLLTTNRIAQNTGGQGQGKGKGHGGQGKGKNRGQNQDFSQLDNPGVVAPPGAQTTARVLAQCTACQLCVSACPSHVIEPSILHYGSFAGLMKPRLNFYKSFCSFDCTTCSDVCPNGTLLPLDKTTKHTTRIGLAHTAHSRCVIVTEGKACGACAEHCPTAALQIKKVPGHPDPLPVVDERYCIGCGACQYPCPVLPKAIAVSGLAVHEKAEILVQEQVKSPTTDDFAF